jgi:hypothetical protein
LLDYGAFGTGSPAETAQQPSGLGNLLSGAYNAMGLLAKRALGNSANAVNTGTYNAWPPLEAAMTAMTGGFAGVPAKAGEAVLGSGFVDTLYHGSPKAGLRVLNESERGPLGPGVYASPHSGVAGRYADEGGQMYELPNKSRDVFNGLGDRYGSGYEGWKADKARLLDAAEPEKREALGAIVDKMWMSDGYPMYARISQLYGGHDGAHALFKRAGFDGLAGHVDGPEVLLFGKQAVR